MSLALAARITLGKFVRLLASDRDGEVVAAARALGRALAAHGCDFHDLARLIEAPSPAPAPPSGGRTEAGRRNGSVETEPTWEEMVEACADWPERFSPREWGLITTLQHWRGEPSEKQINWLNALYRRVA
jgi:hypothetical protein